MTDTREHPCAGHVPTLVIHKYRLPFKSELVDVVEVPVRVGRLLHVAVQHDEIHVWAAVDPGWPEVRHRFRLVGTGSPIDPSWHHLGTVFDRGYVWHIFSEKPTEATDV